MRRIIVSICILCLYAMAWAQETSTTLAIEPFTIEAGKTIEVTANMVSFYDDLCQAQFDLVLPEGISIQSRNGRFYVLGVPDGVIGNEYDEDNETYNYTHQITAVKQNDGSVRVICISSDLTEFVKSSGTLVRIILKADAEIEPGTYSLQLRNVEFTHKTTQQVIVEDSETQFEVEGIDLKGDVNGDGKVDVSDVTALVNIILGK